jgi:hypothetical protein
MRAPLALIALLALGCIDFGLDSRRFRCDGDPSVCADGWTCGADGYCAREGDAADAAAPDAAPQSCTTASNCDERLCHTATCDQDGFCAYQPVAANTACGAGCLCAAGGVATEVACQDGIDNDQDGLIDCQDPDCPGCMGGLVCCDDGDCRTTC